MPLSNNIGDSSSRGSEKPPQTQPQTYLDQAAHALVDPLSQAYFSNARAGKVADETVFYAKSLAKTAPLLMKEIGRAHV